MILAALILIFVLIYLTNSGCRDNYNKQETRLLEVKRDIRVLREYCDNLEQKLKDLDK